MKSAILFALGVVCSVSALAQPQPQPEDPCANADNTIEVNECAARVLKAKDAELNKAYQELLKKFKAASKDDQTDYATIRKELAEAQRAWVRFRDNDCNATLHYWTGGTGATTRYLHCMINRTEQRARELRDWARI
jgi:uncharacterized protein YecT (DUF1311 family)